MTTEETAALRAERDALIEQLNKSTEGHKYGIKLILEARAELAHLREREAKARRLLAKVAAIHERYVATEEDTPEEDAVLNDFDDVCIFDVARFLAAAPPSLPKTETLPKETP